MEFFIASSITTFFASIGFGLFIYNHNRESKISKAWLLLSSTIAIWALSLYGVTSTEILHVALAWQFLLDIFGIFVPVIYFYFISTFLGIKNKVSKTYVISIGIVLSLFSVTPYFKYGVSKTLNGAYWIEIGQYYFLFPLVFFLIVSYSLYLLFKSYTHEKDNGVKAQIRYHIIAGILGFGGGSTNFFPQLFGIFFPIGNYFLLLYILFLGYSVLRHQLFNIKAIAAELLAGGLFLVFLFNFLISPPSFTGGVMRSMLLIAVCIFAILLVRGVTMEVKARERVEKLAQQLIVTNDRLRKLEGQKTEFVSIASHQLRTPLTAIKGYTSMLLEGSFGEIKGEVRDSVQKMFESSQKLVTLVGDLLTISRIEQGRIEYNFANVGMFSLINEIVKDRENDIKEKGLNLSLQTDGLDEKYGVFADKEKIKQVFNNIIENAIKYTPKGIVKIIITDDKPAKRVRVSISDTGIGMSEESIKEIFEQLTDTDTEETDERAAPSGIGIYIAQQIVKAHGGRFWADSPGLGSGTTFFVELPYKRKRITS